MPQVPMPQQSGAVNSRGSGLPAKRSPGNIDYVTADAVGFEILPEALRHALADIFVGAEIAADAKSAVTKRREDGTHYRFVTGWWASSERLVVVEGRQMLKQIGDNRFTPSGEWVPSGIVYQLVSGVVPEVSRWRFDASAEAPASNARRRKVESALEALPPPLVAPILGGLSGAWQRYRRGWALETVVAMLLADDRVRVLKAERESTSLRALPNSEWRATTIDSPVVEVKSISTDSLGQVKLSPVLMPPAELG